MSHIVTIETRVHDLAALRTACRRLQLDEPVHKTTQLFSGEATGHCVELPGWRYPVVCDLKAGAVQFDNFSGRWGKQEELDQLIQIYATEKAKLEARRKGHTVTEQLLEDGCIKLTIQLGEST